MRRVNQFIRETKLAIIILLFSVFSVPFSFADSSVDILAIKQRFIKICYQIEDKKQKKSAYKKLIDDIEAIALQNPEMADIWGLSGHVKLYYSDALGETFTALRVIKSSKQDLEKSLSIDPKAMSGLASILLGLSYGTLPGPPLAFGDDDKAAHYFEAGLALDPDGLYSNFFYGDYLVYNKRFLEAKKYLLKAQAAPSLVSSIEDKGIRDELKALLANVNGQMSKQGEPLTTRLDL